MADSTLSASRGSFRARACDNCRLRKIKCDKAIPCSSCGALGISCTGPGGVAAAAPPQKSLSTAYEQKVDHIQEQLLTIQRALQQLTHPRSSATVRAIPNESTPTPTVPPFEGPSSFHHETLVARDAALSTATESSLTNPNDKVTAALSSLRSSLDRYHASNGNTARSVPQPREELPSVELAVAVVRKVKTRPPFFLVSQSWATLLQIEELSQSIYFPIQPVSSGSITLFYGLLYFIIRDYLYEDDRDLAAFDLLSSMEYCGRKFSAGLNSYEIMSEPTMEKIEALLIGIIKAQEEFDIQRCWSYLSIAFNMCQTLGLHRNYTADINVSRTEESKRRVFWSLYTIDKNISLNIGLTSHFQDHDIDAGLFSPSDDALHRPWDLMALVTVEFAAIQGRVYDNLYSSSASRASDHDRLNAVRMLSSDMIAVRDKLLAIDISTALYADSLQGMAACANFITYSVLTVIYRAQTRSRDAMALSSQCYDAAVLALHSHLKCFTYFRDRQTHKQMEYVNWILLYPSFTPFIIVFTHAITTANTNDLTLLQDTMKSLELVKDLSRGSKHLYTICEAFMKTAQALFDSQQTLLGLEQHQDGSLFAPVTIDGPTNIALPDTLAPDMNQEEISMFLNDFMGTSRPVMEILHSDYMNDVL